MFTDFRGPAEVVDWIKTELGDGGGSKRRIAYSSGDHIT